MDEIRKSSSLKELENIFQEYKTKLEDAEEEANEIIGSSWKKAEIIIAIWQITRSVVTLSMALINKCSGLQDMINIEVNYENSGCRFRAMWRQDC